MSAEPLWQVVVTVDKEDVEAADDALSEAGALSISSFEQDSGPIWRVEALFADEPSRDALTSHLTGGLGREKASAMGLTIEPMPDRDWVTESLAGFPPIPVAGFWIHGSHNEPPDKTRIPILIDAGPAFGSGEHATTEGCLLAIDALAGKRTVARALDMGCGSGILAIAMAKRWPDAVILGVDNDAPSVRFAREASDMNNVTGTVRIAEGDGYRAPEVAELGPFDVIAANILFRPLVAMAPDLADNLVPDGVAILSGLLVDQATRVIAAHEDHGLSLEDRHDLRGWATLVLEKRS